MKNDKKITVGLSEISIIQNNQEDYISLQIWHIVKWKNKSLLNG